MVRGASFRNNKRTRFLLAAVFLVFVACLLRLGWLQIVKGAELTAQGEKGKNLLRELQSPRGAILDREGRELAVSLISLSLYVDPAGMDDGQDSFNGKKPGARDPRKVAAALLADALHKSEQSLYEIFSGDGHFVWLERTMDKDRSDRIRKIIDDNRLNGFGFAKESKRYYPMGQLAAQVIGFVGTDDRGLSGLEMALDSVLKSAVELQLIETDMAGRPIYSSVLEKNKARNMATVYLTIDNRVQFAAEQALLGAMKSTGAKGASALVMDIQTGEVLAMANSPTFDPNHFYNYEPQIWTNKTVSMIYEPGSTFKPIVAAAAVNEGIVEPQSALYDYGKIRVDDREIKNSDNRFHGSVTFSDVIARSINTSMVEIGLRLGAKKINDYARSFGLATQTGIELPGEEEGLLFETKGMRNVDVGSMSIGQGVAVTPLQLVRALGAIANEGKLVQPYVVKKIVQADGQIVRQGGGSEPRVVVSPETSKKVLGMMEKVVSEGSGKLAQIDGYRIAGKTGTAEKLKDGGGYAANEYIASFVGVAPVDKPRFIVLIMIDTPSSAYYGSQIAAPVFRDIMQQTLLLNGIEPTSASSLPVQLPEGAKGQTQARNMVSGKQTNLVGNQTVVPDLKGFTMRDCARILQQSNLTLKPVGSGVASRQQPAALTAIVKGSEVTVWFE